MTERATVSNPRRSPDRSRVGIVLTGGGARAAYQVGVLRTIARIRRDSGSQGSCPIDVFTGTSAGAINAAALASRADDFDAGVSHLFDLWRGITADQVYRTDAASLMATGARWLGMLALGWALPARWRRQPRALLDSTPLAHLLARNIRFNRIRELIATGKIHALAIGTSSYSSGWHVTFYETAAAIEPWVRSQRIAQRAAIDARHLLASSAIPFVFPAAQVDVQGQPEWLGDGTMRQSAPIAPAIHLGAQRVLVIGAGRMQEPPLQRPVSTGYPSLAQVAGHALSSIFLDALASDVERALRINETLGMLQHQHRDHTPLKPIDMLLIAPSRRLDDIAAEHVRSLPRTIRALLGALGASSRPHGQGQALASYLLFEAAFTNELIRLGESDALRKSSEITRFFGWSLSAGTSPVVPPAQAAVER